MNQQRNIYLFTQFSTNTLITFLVLGNHNLNGRTTIVHFLKTILFEANDLMTNEAFVFWYIKTHLTLI